MESWIFWLDNVVWKQCKPKTLFLPLQSWNLYSRGQENYALHYNRDITPNGIVCHILVGWLFYESSQFLSCDLKIAHLLEKRRGFLTLQSRHSCQWMVFILPDMQKANWFIIWLWLKLLAFNKVPFYRSWGFLLALNPALLWSWNRQSFCC